MLPIRVLFISLGNICRSPMAAAIMQRYLKSQKIENSFIVDSAGTSSYHTTSTPDDRSIDIANTKGIQLSHNQARMFEGSDFDRYDFLLVMDHINYEDVLNLSKNKLRDKEKVFLLRSFEVGNQDNFSIPDPYYGVTDDFEEVFKICERSIVGFIKFLSSKQHLLAKNDQEHIYKHQ